MSVAGYSTVVFALLIGVPTKLDAQRSVAHFEPSYSDKKPRVIVMVHGFTGNAESTWLADNGAYFPQLLASDDRIKLANVFVAAYDTRWTDENSTISNLAAALWKQLNDDFGVVSRHQDFIFLCHSLGGLVVEQMLIDHPELAAQTSFIQFYGTPHQGGFSEYSNPINTLIAALGRNRLVPELRAGSSNKRLVKLDDDWRMMGYKNIARLCALETKAFRISGTTFFGPVVDHFSGSHGCDSNTPIDSVAADHIKMVQPKGRTEIAAAPQPRNRMEFEDVQSYLIFLRNYREHPFHQTTTLDGPERDVREYLQVDCERTKSDPDYKVTFPLNPTNKEELVAAKARLENYENIKDIAPNPPQVTLGALGQVSVAYGFNGLDRSRGSCPGGGHATLLIHPTIRTVLPVPDGK
jgi:pimeloyl-ACP methyl ester carboxylesterase